MDTGRFLNHLQPSLSMETATMNSRAVFLRSAATATLFILSLSGSVRAQMEYEWSELMVPVRDGVKLHTVLLRPKGAERPLPLLLQRTPYGVPSQAQGAPTQGPLKRLADDGYIFVFQDIRGRFGSEGTFVLERPGATPRTRRLLTRPPTRTTRSTGWSRTWGGTTGASECGASLTPAG